MATERFLPRLVLWCLAFASSTLYGANPPTCCIWRITNTPAPVYLVGTIHALSGKDYPLPKPYEQVVRECNRLLFEVEPSLKSDFPEKFRKAAKYPEGDEIGRHVHAKTYKFLFRCCRNSNYVWDELKKLRPWAIAYYVWDIRGYNDVFSRHGVDNHLAYQAKRFHKDTGGLETVDEHVEVLRGMADIDAELVLLDAVVQGDKRRETFNRERAAWKRGDIGPIAEELARTRKLNLGAEIRLLDYRNLRWVKRIEAEIKKGQPLAIVAGTGHFVGPNNVRELLGKRGYKIEQL